MTKLRVLSGDHAGASIDWPGDRLTVGRREELDIFIGDWDVQELQLERDADGKRQARWRADDASAPIAGEQRDGDVLFCWLEDLVPVRFGTIILCIGPADAPWPADALLLERCFAPPALVDPPVRTARRAPPKRRLLVIAATLPIVAAGVAVATHLAPSRALSLGRAATASSAAGRSVAAADAGGVLAQQVRRALDPATLARLDVQRVGERLVVRGLLPSRADVDQLNNRLDAVDARRMIDRRFLATPEVTDRLIEALPGREVQVTQEGARRFRVSGTLDDPAHASQAIAQVASDLAEFGLQVDSDLQARHAGLPALSGLLVDSDGTSVLRTSDGVKHIVVGRSTVKTTRIAPAAAPEPLKSAQTELESQHAY